MRDAPIEMIQENEVFSRHYEGFEKCSGPVTSGASKPRGWVSALFTINADGRVSDISFECDTGGAGPGLRECITRELSKLRFPEPKNGLRRTKRMFDFDPK